MNDLILPRWSPVRNCIGNKRGHRAGRGRSEIYGGAWVRHRSRNIQCGFNATTENTMEAPLKELDRLNKLVSDEPSMGKSKTPAIQDSLNSLLQTLHEQKKRLEVGLATEAELTMLARTVEARKKEIDERQKEIYNSLARYGKTLDKVGL